MRNDEFEIKQGARGDWVFFDTGLDLTGASVTVSMRERETGAVKINGASAEVCVGDYTVNGVLRTFAATDGVAVYKWVASDLDTVAFYELEHKTVKAGLASISPSRGYITIIVSDAI